MSRIRLGALVAVLLFAAWWALVVVDWRSYWDAVTGGGL